LATCEIFSSSQGAWPKWPNSKYAYRSYVSSPGTLTECRKQFAVYYGSGW